MRIPHKKNGNTTLKKREYQTKKMGKPHNGNTTQKKLEYHTKKNVNTTPKKI
jgi:hypothetical protein